jgi:protein tyrosine/serine phosphatase
MRLSRAKAMSSHRFLLPAITLVLITLAPASRAQSAPKQVAGVTNFGQVTERYFRGGAVTPAGVDNLAAIGVRTIIDLRDKPSPGEPEACRRNGIEYHKFPMDGSVTPDEKAVNQILSLIQNAKQPAYVHCSAGKHRAGTIAALYRMRVQGWPKERAWAEQQSYGFGPAQGHPELYAYAYGGNSAREREELIAQTATGEVEGKSSKSKEQDTDKQDKAAKQYDSEKDKSSKKEDKGKKAKSSKKDDDAGKAKSSKQEDEAEKDKSSKKADKSSKSSKAKDDDADKDDAKGKSQKEHSDKKSKKKSKNQSDDTGVVTEVAVKADENAQLKSVPRAVPTAAVKSLSAGTRYISLAEAIKRAQAAGGGGEVLKVDLEWDEVRATVTWDVTFSTGNEYEVDALSGQFLGAKAKGAAKLAVLSPLVLNERGFLTFQEIIRKAEVGRGQSVTEMEIKRIKGREETTFEVVLADGTTLLYDATTGKSLTDL